MDNTHTLKVVVEGDASGLKKELKRLRKEMRKAEKDAARLERRLARIVCRSLDRIQGKRD